ncbi:MAG: hypothetical protein V7754_20135 [Halioglobus sp.]
MAAIAFDTLKFARRLIAAGVPEKQAETQAELMAEAFVYNMDSVVTKDYLDARFGEQEARIAAQFTQQDARIDARFSEQDAKFEARFTGIESRFVGIDLQFAKIKGDFRLVYWMLGIIMASTVTPYLQKLFVLLSG